MGYKQGGIRPPLSIDFPVTPKPAFYEWAAQVRQDFPYILGTSVWHIEAHKAQPLCNTRPVIRRRGNLDDVTASNITICHTCQRIANAQSGFPPEAIIRTETRSHQQTP